jgi:hypothetical protein
LESFKDDDIFLRHIRRAYADEMEVVKLGKTCALEHPRPHKNPVRTIGGRDCAYALEMVMADD